MAIFSRGNNRHTHSDNDQEYHDDLDFSQISLSIPDETTEEPAPELSKEEKERLRNRSAKKIADDLHIEYLDDFDELEIDPQAATKATGELCRKYIAVPIKIDSTDNILTIAFADPSNITAVSDFEHLSNMRVSVKAADKDAILRRINKMYRSDDDIVELTEKIEAETEAATQASDESVFVEDDSSPIIQFVNKIIDQAINDRASDIHVEPRDSALVIRYRIDGVLKVVHRAPKSMTAAVLSRIKVMASMDIGEHRRPQDGRISFIHVGNPIDLRVASLPIVSGENMSEKITMRILDAPVASLTLADLNMLDDNMKAFSKGYKRPNGMVLLTGPTGSGKSTTLYTTLSAVASPEVNVITVEDPVEYRMDGINQVQVNGAAGMTFEAALRSILRSDPDIVLIGEVRDKQTAKIAVEAALTGHLVLSTLHTNDAPSTATRLVEMGLEPFLVGQALSCVVAQRLVRKLCPNCKRAYKPSQEELDALHLGDIDPDTLPDIYEKVGCSECANTGYRGRMAIHEVMLMNGQLEKMVATNKTTDEISDKAVANGMTTLRQDCWEKVKLGYTSIEEVFRNTVVGQ
jgi:type IV pilus assembly protein PilB